MTSKKGTQERPQVSAEAMNEATRAFAPSSLDSAPAFIGMCDAQFRPSYLNPAGRSMVSFPDETDLGQVQVSDFFVPGHRKLIDVVGLPTMAREGRWEQDLRFRDWRDPSHEIDVHCSIFGLYDERRRFMAGVTITQQLKSRSRVERALREGRALLDQVLEKLPVGVGVFDATGRLLHSNDGWRRRGVFSLPARASAARQRWKGFGEGDQTRTPQDPGARALRGENVPEEDMLVSIADLTPSWVRVTASPLAAKRAAPAGAVVVLHDIDELKRTKELLARSEAQLSVAAAVSGVGTFTFDPVTGGFHCDERLRQLLGLSQSETFDWQLLQDGIHPEDTSRVRAAIGNCMSANRAQQFTMEYRVRRRSDGLMRRFATTMRSTFDADRMTSLIGASIDITERSVAANARPADTRVRG